MTASCYLCLKNHHKQIPNTQLGDAEGGCKICGVLACAGHGYRDNGVPAFYCILCKVGAIALAGASVSGGERVGDSPLLPPSDSALQIAARSIKSARDLFDGPGAEDNWGWVLSDAEKWTSIPLDTSGATGVAGWWMRLPPEGRLLVACALAIVDRLELPSEDLIPLLQELRTIFARA